MYLIVNNHDARCVAHLIGQITKHRRKSVVLDRAAPLGSLNRAKIKGVFLSGGDNLDVSKPVPLHAISLNLVCLSELSVPIFGICMGFEIMVSALGGILEDIPGPLPSDWVPVTFAPRQPLFAGVPRRAAMPEFNHLRAASVPGSLAVIAHSPRSAIEAVAHRTHPWVATQFHPEAEDDQGNQSPEGLRIISNFLNLCEAYEGGSLCR